MAKLLTQEGLNIPLLIGGATTSLVHTAVKIDPHYNGPIKYVRDAGTAAQDLSHLLSDQKEHFVLETKSEYQRVRENYAKSLIKNPLLSIEESRKLALQVAPAIYKPNTLGQQTIDPMHASPVSSFQLSPYTPSQGLTTLKTFPTQFAIGAWVDASSHDEVMNALMGGAECLFVKNDNSDWSGMDDVLGNIISFQVPSLNSLESLKQWYQSKGWSQSQFKAATYTPSDQVWDIKGDNGDEILANLKNHVVHASEVCQVARIPTRPPPETPETAVLGPARALLLPWWRWFSSYCSYALSPEMSRPPARLMR
jgi:hypothetical protein